MDDRIVRSSVLKVSKEEVIPMAVIKISKQYLIEQDDASITVDVPELLLAQWRGQTGGGDRVREKLARLDLTEKDLEDAVNWAR
jgi:hypothetical protein